MYFYEAIRLQEESEEADKKRFIEILTQIGDTIEESLNQYRNAVAQLDKGGELEKVVDTAFGVEAYAGLSRKCINAYRKYNGDIQSEQSESKTHCCYHN